MAKQDSKFRRAQQRLLKKTQQAIARIDASTEAMGKRIDALDSQYDLTDKTKATGKQLSTFSTAVGLSDALKNAQGHIVSTIESTSAHLTNFDSTHQVSSKVIQARDTAYQHAAEVTQSTGIKEPALDTVHKVQRAYGNVRHYWKPYFEPADTAQLLLNTKQQLVYVTACVLQTSTQGAENWLGVFSQALSAKIAGVAGTGTVLGLVAALGTAGTGTAIASLSGAAATNATLSWMGTIIGGGMGAGALLTAGVGLAIGMGTYRLLGSEARKYEDLNEADRRIVEAAGALVTAIDEVLAKQPVELSRHEAQLFLDNALVPFHRALVEQTEDICSRLDIKNGGAYREHVLRDFEPAVLADFRSRAGTADEPTSRLDVNAVIAGVIYALLSHTVLDGSIEQDMVLQALRRSTNQLQDASESTIANYLSDQTPVQLQGIASNTKGIYHELRWVDDYNNSHDDTLARVMGATNHPGTDVEIVDKLTGEIVQGYQLKATDNLSNIREHQSRYADIEILVTDQSADKLDDVTGSGFSNDELSQDVNDVLQAAAGNTIADQMWESAGIVGLAAAGKLALDRMTGTQNIDGAGLKTLESAMQAAAATGITAFLLG